jgi:hypothetical protein
MTGCVRVLAVCVMLVMANRAAAQEASHAYVSLGAGATDLSGGIDWPVADRVSIGGQMGVGWVLLAAATGSYHVRLRPAQPYDLFATGGYAWLGSSEFSSHGAIAGGGATYWLTRRVGLRVDALKVFQIRADHQIPVEARSPPRNWVARAGVALRVR